jgi:hypothetical protein
MGSDSIETGIKPMESDPIEFHPIEFREKWTL